MPTGTTPSSRCVDGVAEDRAGGRLQLAKTPASTDPVAVLEATGGTRSGSRSSTCVFPDWKFQPADFVAARGLHAALVVGEPVYVEPGDIAQLVTDMAAFTLRLLRNNEVGRGRRGKKRAEEPGALRRRARRGVEAARRRNTAGRRHQSAPATLTTSLPIAAGDVWIASLSGIPPSSLTLRVTNS